MYGHALKELHVAVDNVRNMSSAALQGVRVAIILTAFQHRKATFLSSKEWCTVPWQFRSKPAWQKVIDITAQIPEVLEKFDQLQGMISNKKICRFAG